MLALKTPGLELPKSVQNITLAKYKLMLEHTACMCIVKEWAELHTSENSGQLTLRWAYYNHALRQVQNITLAKYKLMLEHTACICIVKEWAEQHTSENSGQLTLRWVYYNHALKQVAYLFNKVIICVQTHATMVVRLMLIFSLINGL